MHLFAKNAVVTSGWCSGEVYMHILDNTLVGYVNDCINAAVTQPLMPSLEVRDMSGKKCGGWFCSGQL